MGIQFFPHHRIDFKQRSKPHPYVKPAARLWTAGLL